MSGIGGWLGWRDDAERENRARRLFSKALAQFDAAPTEMSSAAGAFVAAAGETHEPFLAVVDGAHVVLAGDPRGSDGGYPADATGFARELLASWREQGASCLESLRGSFCVALVDSREQRALLAVDRCGSIPLSWAAQGGALVWATRGNLLQAHPAVAAPVDPQAIYQYLYHHVVPAPRTARVGHRRLLPGECLQWEGGRARVATWWKMQFTESAERNLPALEQQFRDLLEQSVARALEGARSGAFLSGGTDSSSIVGMIRKVTGEAPRVYSIGFGVGNYDELEYARLAAERFGAVHREYTMQPDDVLDVIPRLAAVHSEPFGNESAVPAYLCARLAASDGLTRLLGGDGGDELLGGNSRYARQKLFESYFRVPHWMRAGFLEPLLARFPLGDHLAPIRKGRSFVHQAHQPMPGRMSTYNYLERLGAERMLEPAFLAQVDPGEPARFHEESYHGASATCLVNRMLAMDMRFTLADNDLPKVSRSCELAGVQAAYPFLSEGLLDFAAALPADLKVRRLRLRWLFKRALRDFLPRSILSKRKHGFGLPFGLWLCEHEGLRSLAGDCLADLRGRGILRPAFLDELWRLHETEHPTYYGVLIWNLMMLELWFRNHGD